MILCWPAKAPFLDFFQTLTSARRRKKKMVALTDSSRLSRGRQFFDNTQYYPASSSLDPDADLASVYSEDLSAYRFLNGNALDSDIDNCSEVPQNTI